MTPRRMGTTPKDAATLQRHSPIRGNLCVLPIVPRFLGAVLALVLGSSVLWAEGYTFKDGHFDFPEVFKPGIKISLTKEQSAQIRAEAAVEEAPTKLQIYKVANLEGDCTCGLVNFAIIIEGGRVEAPHYRVVSDREAAYYEE